MSEPLDPVSEMELSEQALNQSGSELRASDSSLALSKGELGAMFASIADETVDRPTNFWDRIRELSTPVRIALAVLGAVIMAAVVLIVTGVRGDLSGQAILRYAISMTAIAGLVGAAFSVSFRGVHQKPLGPWVWVFVITALTIPLVLAVMPWLWEAPPVVADAHDHGFGMCLALGLVTGGLTTAVAWVFQRPRLAGALAHRCGGCRRRADRLRDAAAPLSVPRRDPPSDWARLGRLDAGGRGGRRHLPAQSLTRLAATQSSQ